MNVMILSNHFSLERENIIQNNCEFDILRIKKSALSFKDDLKSDVKLDIIETFEDNKKYFNVVLGPFDDVNTLYDMHKNDTFSSYEDLFLIIL